MVSWIKIKVLRLTNGANNRRYSRRIDNLVMNMSGPYMICNTFARYIYLVCGKAVEIRCGAHFEEHGQIGCGDCLLVYSITILVGLEGNNCIVEEPQLYI